MNNLFQERGKSKLVPLDIEFKNSFDEWRLALNNPNSFLYKQMFNSFINELFEKKIIEDMFASFVKTMVGEVKQQQEELQRKKHTSDELYGYQKMTTNKHTKLFA